MGNKCDMDESKRAVPYSKGQALADELGIQFFETSAKSNINVTEVLPTRLSEMLLSTSPVLTYVRACNTCLHALSYMP